MIVCNVATNRVATSTIIISVSAIKAQKKYIYAYIYPSIPFHQKLLLLFQTTKLQFSLLLPFSSVFVAICDCECEPFKRSLFPSFSFCCYIVVRLFLYPAMPYHTTTTHHHQDHHHLSSWFPSSSSNQPKKRREYPSVYLSTLYVDVVISSIQKKICCFYSVRKPKKLELYEILVRKGFFGHTTQKKK